MFVLYNIDYMDYRPMHYIISYKHTVISQPRIEQLTNCWLALWHKWTNVVSFTLNFIKR